MAQRVGERRKHPRVETNVGAKVTAGDSGFEATVKNISASGLLLVSERAVPEMTIVGMRLAFPGEGRKPGYAFDLTGAVVRCQPCGRGTPRTYELAVFLTDLPPETRAALQDFVGSRLG